MANAAGGVTVVPHYKGFRGQSVAVLVSTDRSTQIDFQQLQLDTARGVQAKLAKAQPSADELKGTTFPKDKSPEALYAFQRNNPNLMYEPMVNVAPRLGVSRLIYIEVESFQLHPEEVPELYRGSMAARVQVFEVAGGVAKSAFDERARVSFPERSPEEGLPDLGDGKTYIGTLDAFTTAVLEKFVTHQEAR